MNLNHLIEKYSSGFSETETHYVLKCPDCGRNKMYVDKKKKLFICFRCGLSGGFVKLVSVLKGIGWEDALKLVKGSKERITEEFARGAFSLFDNKEKGDDDQKTIFLPEDYRPISFYKKGDDCFDYVRGRGISLEQSDQFSMGYSQKTDRVIFPVFLEGDLVGWQGRSVKEDATPKIKNCVGFDKSKYLYGYDFCSVPNYASLVICEGPIDCVKASELFPSVGLFGKKISSTQLSLILSLKKDNVFIGLDPDAIDESMELARRLFGLVKNIYMMEIPLEKDLGNSTTKEIWEYYLNSKRFTNGKTIRLFT